MAHVGRPGSRSPRVRCDHGAIKGAALRMRSEDKRSEAAIGWRSWYGTPRWRALRLGQLKAQPFCLYCAEAGHQVRATVCDHAERHSGDPAKFWNGPFRSLCQTHHNSSKQREERKGFSAAVSADGWPLDDRHPSNAGSIQPRGGHTEDNARWETPTANGTSYAQSRNSKENS